MSNTINFIDNEQVVHYCMFACFLIEKPKDVSPYFVIRLIGDAGRIKRNGDRGVFVVKEVTGRVVGVKEVEGMLAGKS